MPRSDLEVTALRMVSTLRRMAIPFHLTGGIASAFYGEPRFTQDVDIVVQLDLASARELVRELGDDFFVEESAAVDAVLRRTSFQALDRRTFIKVDLHVGEKIPGELSRSVLRPVFEGVELPLVSKEDAIVSKLLWLSEGSPKSRRDIIGMLLDPGPFDRELLRKLAAEVGCRNLLEELLKEVGAG